jgi:predicted DNA-binding transcriptional regulator AlpA
MTDTAADTTTAAVPGRRLFVEDVAERTGLSKRTLYGYNSAATNRRRRRKTRPWDLPPPDGHERRKHGPPSPWWHEATIDAWQGKRLPPGAFIEGARLAGNKSPKRAKKATTG